MNIRTLSAWALAAFLPLLMAMEIAVVAYSPRLLPDEAVVLGALPVAPQLVLFGRLFTLALMVILLVSGPSRIGPRPTGRTYVLGGVIIYWLAAMAFPALINDAGDRPYSYLYPLVVLLLFASTPATGFDAITRVFQFSVAVASIVSLAIYVVRPDIVADVDYEGAIFGAVPRLAGFTQQANLTGAVLVPYLLLLMWSPLSKVPQWVAVGAGIAALIATQSKTSMMALLLGYAWLTMARRPRGQRGTILAMVCLGGIAVVGVAVILIALGLVPRLSPDQLAEISSGTGRNVPWNVAMDAWASNPIFGYGPMLFRDGALASYPTLGATTHAHNQIFDTLGRSGIVGLFGFVVMIGMLIAAIVRLPDSEKAIAIALFLALLVQSLFETPINMTGLYFLMTNFWLLVGLTSAYSR